MKNKFKTYKKNIFWGGVFVAFSPIFCCTRPSDTPSYGKITIAADESLQPVVEQLCQAYKGTHPETDFSVLFCSEEKAAKYVLADSARLAFITRELTGSEQQVFKTKGIKYNPQFIATDGVALLANRANTDSLISIDELASIFKGDTKSWGQLKKGSPNGEIILVFDNANSSNINFIRRKFGLDDLKGLNIFSAGSNKKVIEYVRQTPNALGFIGVNWISDGDVPLTAELSKGLRVMGVSEKTSSNKEDYFQPFQKDLRYKTYPLRRDVYIINREMSAGLGSGLLNYIMRDVGSLVIEKCGLWPSSPFKREIILKKGI